MTKTTFLFLFLFLIFCSLIKSSVSNNTLPRGSSLSVDHDDKDLLTSSDNTFTCGFYAFQTNAYWFAIWFTNSKNHTVVWTANPNRPVNGRGSKVTFQRNGVMVLTDVDGMVVWETNITSTDANTAVLLNTGNLVLKNSKGDILWQSFDYPTDTLLPSQTLTKSKRLISSSREGSLQSGYFNLNFEANNVLTLSYDGPEISSMYFPSRDPNFEVWRFGRTSFNSSRIAVFNDVGEFYSSDGWRFNASDHMNSGIKRRMTIDHDGNLRIYSLNDSTGLWLVTWQVIAQPCNVHGICGRNGICVHGEIKPECSCPPHHEWSDPTDLSKGCRPTFNTTCVNSTSFEFVELLHTDYYGFDLNYSTNISQKACRDVCLGDCGCDAYVYKLNGDGLCYAKSALFNGYSHVNVEGTVYLKVPIGIKTTSMLTSSMATCTNASVFMIGSPSMYESSKTTVKWIYPYFIALAIGVVEVLLILLGCWVFYGNNAFVANIEDGYRLISNQFRGFSYQELKKATQDFKVEIGRGGSGVVYKGILDDQRVVAVKRLEHVTEGGEFWAEVSTIGHINHMNLVQMWGFCSEKRHRLVVYEYVQNLSLDKRLFSSSFLQWEERFKVAIGIAKGLAYLHHECLEWVIHCDVKPENILLDAAFEPKIADFGLAKLSERGGQNEEFTKIRGTKGYMAPEWAHNLPITAKVDVYSYGVVVLEMAKGIRLPNVIVQGEEDEESALMRFVRLVKSKIEKGKNKLWIEEIIDPRLEGLFSRKQAAKLVEIGIACVEEDRNKRPTMDSVVQALVDCEAELYYKE